ncbi:MAG: hypothetical protein AAF702_31860 [Chloroflexota bacterium]
MSYHISRLLESVTFAVSLILLTTAALFAAPPNGPHLTQGNPIEASEYNPEIQDGTSRLVLTKSVRVPNDPVRPGDLVAYQVELAHIGDDGMAEATLVDELPRGMRLVGRPQLTVETPRVSPQQLAMRDRKIVWSGQMASGAKLTITYPMQAKPCFDGQAHQIENTVKVRQTGGPDLSETASFTLRCRHIDPALIEVTRTTLGEEGEDTAGATDGDESSALDPNKDYVRTTITNGNPDPVVLGLRAYQAVVPASNETEEAQEIPEGAPVETKDLEKLTLDPGESISFTQAVTPPQEIENDNLDELEIISDLGFCVLDEESSTCEDEEKIHRPRPIRIRILRRDLGDAADSSNHFGVHMDAYAGTKGHFPTVFDPATGLPSGPAHLFPGPFHLGKHVSREAGADLGRDVDPFNNLEPRRDQANLDRHDDGLRPRQIEFIDCQSTTIDAAVSISPRAVAYLQHNEGKGYVNIWLDSNRDGDWEDGTDCVTSTNESARALEHIVIDHEIDTSALGAGRHLINVPTGIVSWPEKYSEKPVWLRVTLSTRPANKALMDGDVAYGDGRGYRTPFILGETEDYKFQQGELVDGADVVVHKRGAARKDFEGDPENIRGRTHWHIRYYNQGMDTAQNTTIQDTLPSELDANPDTLQIRTSAGISYTVDGQVITFDVGDLDSDRGGHIMIRANYIIPDEEAVVVTNTVTISATNDANLENNQDQAKAQLGLRSPVITWPANGTTCNSDLEVHGRARPNALVDLYLNDEFVVTVAVDQNGHWQHPLTLEDGTHYIHAVAKLDDVVSLASRAKMVIVDSTLVYDPLSIRFVDENGNDRRPRDKEGRTDVDGWGLHLRPNTSYSVTVRLCCSDSEATATLNIPNVGMVEMSYNEARDRFVGSFTTGDMAEEPEGEAMELTVSCEETTSTFGGIVLIDPEGVVYDASTGQLLSGANVACMEAQVTGASGESGSAFTLWNAEAFGQINPQSTLADGYFSFWTPAGTYQLNVTRDGYQPYRSADILVVDELVRYDVPLSPIIDEAADHVVEISEAGLGESVLTVEPGAIVEWVNMDLSSHRVMSVAADSVQSGSQSTSTWDSGLLVGGESYKVQFDTEGTFTYTDQENGANVGTIIVATSTPDNPTVPDEDDDQTPTGSQQSMIFLPLIQD